MRFANSTSWRASWGSDDEVDVALYMRDALALSVEEDQVLPPVEPSVPVRIPPGVDREAIQAQWSDWWVDLMAFLSSSDDPDPRGSGARYRRPALGPDSAMRKAMADFAELAAEHKRRGRAPAWQRETAAGGLVGELVAEAEQRLERQSRPFSLTFIEISVAGSVWRHISDDHILVSARLAEDRPALTEALREEIAKHV